MCSAASPKQITLAVGLPIKLFDLVQDDMDAEDESEYESEWEEAEEDEDLVAAAQV